MNYQELIELIWWSILPFIGVPYWVGILILIITSALIRLYYLGILFEISRRESEEDKYIKEAVFQLMISSWPLNMWDINNSMHRNHVLRSARLSIRDHTIDWWKIK